MLFHCAISVMLLFVGLIPSAYGQQDQKAPDTIYPDLEYMLSLAKSTTELDPEKLTNLIDFVSSVPVGTGMSLEERQDASGAFYAFSVQGNFNDVLDYVYNPDIPLYVTMPSSLRQHEWITPQIPDLLRDLPRQIESTSDIRLLRGEDREVITPDANTGGYYSYSQDRVVAVLPGPAGPVLISVSSQNDSSDIGKKGCIVGKDTNWDYLYSSETGLNKTGLGWVDSYMYNADSVLVYVVDSSANEIRMGSFKWLNAGWASINMVKSSHILEGIKRFAADFKTVLESPGLPSAEVLEEKYKELEQTGEQDLRLAVSSYLKTLKASDASCFDSSPFKGPLSSGEYQQQMDREELIQVLLLQYVKGAIGKGPAIRLASQPSSLN